VARITGEARAGDEVRVLDAKGNVLGRGLYSPKSAIQVRLYTRDGDQPLDEAFIRERLLAALARRRALGLPSDDTDSFRALNSEGDGLPGLVIDQLGDVSTLQFSTLGMKQRAASVAQAVQSVLGPRAIVDRTPARTAELEGFEPGSGVIAGDPGLESLRFTEAGLKFEVPLSIGQKTGFYLDLRELRKRLARLAVGRQVLDCYCYVGAAGLSMARAGAKQVLSVDSSQVAVDIAKHCVELNQLGARMRVEHMPAATALEQAAAAGGVDLVLCDPPKLAPKRSAVERAQRAMETLAHKAILATRPGGLVVLCSCSAGLGSAEVQRALAVGAAHARRRVTILDRVFQDVDHPVPAAFPEGLYLSCLIAEVSVDR
jgi:23S rRNA (cytosine1962-C5)-methyltransferase